MNFLTRAILQYSYFRLNHHSTKLTIPDRCTRLSRILTPVPLRINFFASQSLPPSEPEPNSQYMESVDPLRSTTPDDFVHIENPTLRTEALNDSIINVVEDSKGEEILPDMSDREDNNYEGGDFDGTVELERTELPEELSRRIVHLTCDSVVSETGTCDVYLVGTAHVSIESCKEVQVVIDCLKPEVVFLELCSSRVAALTPQSLKVPTFQEMIEMYKKKHNAFGILYSWFLAKVASKLEVFPGSEFRIAFEEARKYGAKVILGDRPVQVTLRRTWAKMPLWHKMKLLFSLLFQTFFLPSAEGLNKMLKEMDDIDMITLVIQEMSKTFPTLMETLVHERDQYMSSKLLAIASEHGSVVAVIGKGHLQGIKKYWKESVQIDDLMELPLEAPILSTRKVLASVSVGIAGLAILTGIYLTWKK